MTFFRKAIIDLRHPEEAPPGPPCGRPEDRLRGGLEGRTAERGLRYCATQPPSIESAAPVIVEAASPHRKTASAPIFSGVV